MNDRPATKGRRFLRLAGMTAQVAGGYAKSRLKSVFQSEEEAERERVATHQRSGELIAQTLGELKGAVMKMGQMASIAREILPRELSEALQSLQREAPPMPFSVIAEQIEREFGSPPETLFRQFDKVPFAAASIGQVHRAVVDDGREVVVKVQYPGVDDAVDSDLAHLKLALRASGLVRVRKKALDALFSEIRDRLHEELDYCNEADNVRSFAAAFTDWPDVVIPEVVGERSSKRVLTLGYEPSDGISDLGSYDASLRDRLGDVMVRALLFQIFELQLVHADPNPANFGFRRDGSLVLYDFGCIKRVVPDVADAYASTIRGGLREDYALIEDGLRRLGGRNLDGPEVPPEFYKRWRDIFARPFDGDSPYDFASADLHKDALKLVPGFLAKHVTSFEPIPELVFIDRAVIGCYGNLRRMGVRGQFRPLLEAHLQRRLGA